ncbi:MAG: VC0807 family protein [Acidimicrobiales bacterium]
METAGLAGMSRAAVFTSVVRRSGPNLLEASVIPTALFYAALVMAGLGTAYAAALLWLYAAAAIRLARREAIPPLLVLGLVGITVRTAVAIASGSTFVYFAQPVANSLVMTGVFLVSVAVGRPLIEQLALEFWPLTPELLALPSVSRLLRGLTFLWAGVNLAIGATTMTLLLCLPLATYVAAKQLASLAITGVGMAITIDRSLRVARREGYVVEQDAAPRFGGLPAVATIVD